MRLLPLHPGYVITLTKAFSKESFQDKCATYRYGHSHRSDERSRTQQLSKRQAFCYAMQDEGADSEITDKGEEETVKGLNMRKCPVHDWFRALSF